MIENLVARSQRDPSPFKSDCHLPQCAQQRLFCFQGKGGTRDVLDGMGDAGEGLQRMETSWQGSIFRSWCEDVQRVCPTAMHPPLPWMPPYLCRYLRDNCIRRSDEDHLRCICQA